MPFAPYRTTQSSDALHAAQAAFDHAWAEVSLDTMDEQTARMIARRIIDAVESGERNPVRLKAYALRVFET